LMSGTLFPSFFTLISTCSEGERKMEERRVLRLKFSLERPAGEKRREEKKEEGKKRGEMRSGF